MKDFLLWGTVLIISIIFFFFVGEKSYVMQKDSHVYTDWIYIRSIMPIYPCFIEFLKWCFGEAGYLDAAVIAQGFISAFCAIDFCLFIKKQFRLNRIDFLMTFLLSLLVYTIEFPGVVNNHFIMTESLSYPFFYIYIKYLLKGILNQSKKDLAWGIVWTFILSLIRSQLQLLWAVSAMTIAYYYLKLHWEEFRKICWKNIAVRCLVSILLLGVVTFGGYKLVSVSVSTYRQILFGNERATDYQGVYAFWDRISYTMDKEDENLFENPQTKAIFQRVYEKIDDAQYRYEYRPKNLWTWNHVATAASKNGQLAGDAIYEYLDAQGIADENEKRKIEAQVMRELSVVLMQEHWDRYIYYTLTMIPQGFICTVFVQKEAFYALCHIITFMIYVTALLLGIRCIKKKSLDSAKGESMLWIILISVMLVGITNIVFMGLQRYLYYMYGVFYIGFYLVFRENFLINGFSIKWYKRQPNKTDNGMDNNVLR
ncbi:MAG: hypothetical protein IJ485_07445 [Lachnospiraceae bacterium]|nr:hypothetical protein [Lachnospiraceae bacterium]